MNVAEWEVVVGRGPALRSGGLPESCLIRWGRVFPRSGVLTVRHTGCRFGSDLLPGGDPSAWGLALGCDIWAHTGPVPVRPPSAEPLARGPGRRAPSRPPPGLSPQASPLPRDSFSVSPELPSGDQAWAWQF